MVEKDEILDGLKDSILEQDEDMAAEFAEKALESDVEAFEAISDGLARGMEIIGDKFGADEIFLPQVMMSADAMEAAMEELRPALKEGDKETKGTVLLGTVNGDVHTIGKEIVGSMIEGAGFEVVDIGKEQPVENFIKGVQEEDADVLGASALMSTTRSEQEKIVEAVKEEELDVKTIFGGAPVTAEYVEEIGGDGYAADGAEAKEVVEELMKKK